MYAAVKKTLSSLSKRFDTNLSRFIFQHPGPGFLIIFIGVPFFVLMAVCACTALVSIPIAWFCGWL